MADLGREPTLLIPGLVVLPVLLALSCARLALAIPRAPGWSVHNMLDTSGNPIGLRGMWSLRERFQN